MNTINNNTMRLNGFPEPDMKPHSVGDDQQKAMGLGAGLTLGTTPISVLDALDEVDPVVDAALTRSDDMGKLMNKVFNFLAPPMPDFN